MAAAGCFAGCTCEEDLVLCEDDKCMQKVHLACFLRQFNDMGIDPPDFLHGKHILCAECTKLAYPEVTPSTTPRAKPKPAVEVEKSEDAEEEEEEEKEEEKEEEEDEDEEEDEKEEAPRFRKWDHVRVTEEAGEPGEYVIFMESREAVGLCQADGDGWKPMSKQALLATATPYMVEDDVRLSTIRRVVFSKSSSGVANRLPAAFMCGGLHQTEAWNVTTHLKMPPGEVGVEMAKRKFGDAPLRSEVRLCGPGQVAKVMLPLTAVDTTTTLPYFAAPNKGDLDFVLANIAGFGVGHDGDKSRHFVLLTYDGHECCAPMSAVLEVRGESLPKVGISPIIPSLTERTPSSIHQAHVRDTRRRNVQLSADQPEQDQYRAGTRSGSVKPPGDTKQSTRPSVKGGEGDNPEPRVLLDGKRKPIPLDLKGMGPAKYAGCPDESLDGLALRHKLKVTTTGAGRRDSIIKALLFLKDGTSKKQSKSKTPPMRPKVCKPKTKPSRKPSPSHSLSPAPRRVRPRRASSTPSRSNTPLHSLSPAPRSRERRRSPPSRERRRSPSRDRRRRHEKRRSPSRRSRSRERRRSRSPPRALLQHSTVLTPPDIRRGAAIARMRAALAAGDLAELEYKHLHGR